MAEETAEPKFWILVDENGKTYDGPDGTPVKATSEGEANLLLTRAQEGGHTFTVTPGTAEMGRPKQGPAKMDTRQGPKEGSK